MVRAFFSLLSFILLISPGYAAPEEEEVVRLQLHSHSQEELTMTLRQVSQLIPFAMDLRNLAIQRIVTGQTNLTLDLTKRIYSHLIPAAFFLNSGRPLRQISSKRKENIRKMDQ